MKTNKTITLLLTGVLLISGFTACNKDKDDNGSPSGGGSKGELVGKKWKITGMTIAPGLDIDGDGDLETDVFQFTPACAKDDYVVFKDNGKTEAFSGTNLCDGEDGTVENGTWSFESNKTKMKIVDEDGTYLWDIISLNNNTFKVSYTETFEVEEGETQTQTVTATLTSF
ncbi:lipocalin family protein [Solitalea sp. MAHUQ-68]|uniref:Lipocalin family protein n=1 Tax=Solitalea agri TaxID=2953739 RepID=A0A9X2JCC6_9SPHI|nr:lipocalin family protein [Solitalea agri]MCO4292389.1 lipocalin family protein [Solitalea agri]